MNRILLGIVVIVFFSGIGCSKVSSKIEMVLVPSGTFQLDDTTTNRAYVSSFYMSKTEITRKQFKKVMGYDPSDTNYSIGQQYPVQKVNWYEALVFCNNLSMREDLTPVYTINGSTDPARWGEVPTSRNSTWDSVTVNWNAKGYRLPTDMEWMWAAMGADKENPGKINTTGYIKKFAGDNGSNSIENYAWYDNNSNDKTHPAGTKQPNELGLYDMSGNVYEWCWDRDSSYPTGPLTNYSGAASGDSRVYRGGSWYSIASFVTVAFRNYSSPCNQLSNVGFRVVRSN